MEREPKNEGGPEADVAEDVPIEKRPGIGEVLDGEWTFEPPDVDDLSDSYEALGYDLEEVEIGLRAERGDEARVLANLDDDPNYYSKARAKP